MIGSVSSSSSYYAASSAAASPAAQAADPRVSGNKTARPAAGAASQLSPEEQQQVEKLKERDAHVRAHEMAHLAAAGSLARGGPSYVYQTGPDGKPYAIGGSVKIDTSPGRTPEETARKAALVRSAALAVSDPSPQDASVAAKASTLLAEAQQQRDAKQPEPAETSAREPDAITSSRQLAPAAEGADADAPATPAGSPASSAARAAAAAARYQRN